MNFPINQPVIVLVGPTAVGKTALSLHIAEQFDCEIISMDSMQVYRYMDIGTAKASKEEQAHTPHHLIDIVNPDEEYDANRFVIDALHAVRDIHDKNKIPLVTGGTGLYLRSLVEGIFQGVGEYPQIRADLQRELQQKGVSKLHEELFACDRVSAERINKNDTHRVLRALEIYRGSGMPWSEHLAAQKKDRGIRFSNLVNIALQRDREVLYERINKRTTLMLNGGLPEEVKGLLDKGYSRELKSMQSIGYRHMVEHLIDNLPLAEVKETLARDTRRYAKRQLTWFKKVELEWFDADDHLQIMNKIHDKIIT